MRSRLLFLFVVTPLVEMVLLIQLGQWLGFWPTFLLVLLTGAMGGLMARSQGLATWQRFQTSLSSGRLPANELIDGVVILISAALLLTPGVLTDIAGFMGLIPQVRTRLRRLISKRAAVKFSSHGPGFSASFTGPLKDERPTTSEHGWTGEARRRPHGETEGSNAAGTSAERGV